MFKLNKIMFLLLVITGCLPQSNAPDKSGVLEFSGQIKRSISSVNQTRTDAAYRGGDRFYLESMLMRVFGPSYDNSSIVSNNISKKLTIFGGICDHYEHNLDNNNRVEFPKLVCHQDVAVSVLAPTSIIRTSWIINTCEQVINSNQTALTFAFKRAGINPDVDKYSAEKGDQIYKLFYPIGALSNDVSLVYEQAYTKDLKLIGTNKEFWTIVLLSVCLTPEWQIP
jgi:hypothetical protein